MRRNGKILATTATVAAMLAVIGMLPTASAATPHAGTTSVGAASDWRGRSDDGGQLSHVFIIMLENHALDNTIGDINPATGKLSMPYLTMLSKTYGNATNYYGVTHTSEPNYIAATSGNNWWVNNDNEWTVVGNNTFGVNHYDHTNIADELQAAHIPWAAYMEAMPTAGYLEDSWPSDSNALYVSKHNPFDLYTDIHNNPSIAKNIKPYSDMARDLNSRNAPRYVWISPDECHNMHNGIYTAVPGFADTPCPYPPIGIGDPTDEHSKTVADNFVKQAVSTIMHSKAWTGNSVIFITADEVDFDAANGSIGDYLSAAGCCDSPVVPPADPQISADWPGGVYGGGLVPMVVISRNGPHHVTDNTAYNHYSMLLTIEEGFGLGKLGYTSDAAQVKPMWPLITRTHVHQ